MGKKSTVGGYVAPRVAARLLGVTTATLRNWANRGRIEYIKTPSGQRRYSLAGFFEAEAIELAA